MHGFRYHLLTSVFTSHSYETVASILGPSGSIVSKEDWQHMDSMDSKDSTLTPSDEFLSHLVDNTAGEQKQESQCRKSLTKHFIEYPMSAEPYMQDFVDGGTQSPSPASDNNRFLVCASIKKCPLLTQTDITEVSNISDEELSDKGATLGQCPEKEQSLTGQDSGQTSVNIKNVLVRHQTGRVEDSRTFSEPDKG